MISSRFLNLALTQHKKNCTSKPHPKTKFTEQEDTLLAQLVGHFGEEKWNEISLYMNGRSIRQCRERWRNYLSPSINRSEWSLQEDALLASKYEELGPKWKQISRFFQNRTDISLKNRLLVLVRKESKRIRMQFQPTKRKRVKPQNEVQQQVSLCDEQEEFEIIANSIEYQPVTHFISDEIPEWDSVFQ